MTYKRVTDEVILKMLRDLVSEHHEELRAARIEMVFRYSGSKRKTKPGSRVVLGRANRTTGAMRCVAPADFVIVLNADQWSRLKPAQQLALIDHELCHCALGPNGDWATRKHDVTEFAQIIERHGLWLPDLEQVGKAAREWLFDPQGKE